MSLSTIPTIDTTYDIRLFLYHDCSFPLRVQTLSKIRMRDGDQRLSALFYRFSAQQRDAVFGHDVIDIIARGRYSATGVKIQGDTGKRPLFCGRGQRDDGASALAHIGAADKVNLPAHARKLAPAQTFGTDLTCQIHLQRRVNSDKVVMRRNDAAVICIIDRMHLHGRIVIDIFVKLVAPHQKSGDTNMGVYSFLTVGDDSRFNKLHNTVREHFGVDADRQISRLSGGQQQRVFLARALAQEAEIYFMDEPFKGVDAQTERAIVALLKALKAQGKTVIVVHHDLQTVPDYFDWVTLINLRVVASGPVEEVFHEENLKKTYHSAGALLRGVV